jgi:hypothetical protein
MLLRLTEVEGNRRPVWTTSNIAELDLAASCVEVEE